MSCVVICNSDEKGIDPDVFVTTVLTMMPVRNSTAANPNQWSSVLLDISARSPHPRRCREWRISPANVSRTVSKALKLKRHLNTVHAANSCITARFMDHNKTFPDSELIKKCAVDLAAHVLSHDEKKEKTVVELCYVLPSADTMKSQDRNRHQKMQLIFLIGG